jgi:hypothetical protein
MRAVHLGAADRQPVEERGVQFGYRVEAARGEHVLATDQHLAFDPALPGRPVGG